MLGEILGWLLSKRREEIVDKRESTRLLASELDKLADFMSEILKVTAPNGKIQQDKLPELELIRDRVWNRWCSLLGTSGFASQDPEIQSEVEKCIYIAHAAPGAYIEEILLIQESFYEGYVSKEVKDRFAKSIDKIRDTTTKMRLNA